MLKITFWGTRGSIPTPSTKTFHTAEYGGNTTCVCIENQYNEKIIIDAGTGIRLLGIDLIPKLPVDCALLFTHLHWDHIQGFPFFAPLFIPGNTISVYGPQNEAKHGIEYTMRGQQRHPHFPVDIDMLAADIRFYDITPLEKIQFKHFDIFPFAQNHPGTSIGYKICCDDHAISFCTDIEHIEKMQLTDHIKGSDLLVYDGQYTDDEYTGASGMSRKGWGHSTFSWGLKEMFAADIPQLIITHHDPSHNDEMIHNIEDTALKEFRKLQQTESSKSCNSIFFAKEGTTFTVT